MFVHAFYGSSALKKLIRALGFLLLFIQFSATAATSNCKEKFGIIHNSLIPSEQTIMLGINPMGNLNTDDDCGASPGLINSLNVNKYAVGTSFSSSNSVNPGAVGISYYWQGGQKWDSINNRWSTKFYKKGWYDSTSQGTKWESWSAGAADSQGKVIAWGAVRKEPTPLVDGTAGTSSMTLKSFTVDSTSVQSTVVISDSVGNAMLQVTHVYGPTSGVTNKSLFQGLVTITNISGMTLDDVRYRRSMDWDILENTSNVTVDAIGINTSYGGEKYPQIWSYCNNGGEDNVVINPFVSCAKSNYNKNTYLDSLNKDSTTTGQIGSSFDFKFGALACNESATFYIYYGASDSKDSLAKAMGSVGATTYSMGYDPNYNNLAYAFGFKGVSGTAVAPVLPTKVTSLPAGSSTRSDIWQTYAPPILWNGYIYQALFKFQKDKQWIGEIKRYELDSSGEISDNPLLASISLKNKASNDARSIWTVGYDPICMSSKLDLNINNFKVNNAATLKYLLFNCSPPSNLKDTEDLIKFTIGQNTNLEEQSIKDTEIRSSVLGDTYHSEMVMVGPPNALYTKDVQYFKKSEAYYRFSKGYDLFIASNKNREARIYVGANDGMLHSFDDNLIEKWAFIPPSVLPNLRGMTSETGKSNSIFNVDGPIAIKDVYIRSDVNSTPQWKTLLIGGLGWGGNSYYALDITDPASPKHLFTFNNDVPNKVINYWNANGDKSTFPYDMPCSGFDYSKLGGAWSRPVIMLMPYGTSQKWVAVFGGGYAGGESVSGTGSASSFGGYVFVIDLEPNAQFSTGATGCGDKNGITSTGGHLIASIPLENDSASKIPNGVTAHLTVVNGDGTSLADYYGGIAYFTDLQGKLWKLNLSQAELTDSYKTNLFDISQSYEFRSEATLANDRMGFNQLGTTIVSSVIKDTSTGIETTTKKLFNYFGTGDLTRIQRKANEFKDGQFVSTINNRIYGIVDSAFPESYLDAKEKRLSITDNPQSFTNIHADSTCAAGKSWYADVWERTTGNAVNDFQKIVGRAAVFNKYVYFSAYAPEENVCPLYGVSRLIEVTDTCKRGNASSGSGTGAADIGPGLATSPTIDSRGNIYVGISNMPNGSSVPHGRDNIAKLTSSVATPGGKNQYKSWREKRVY